MHLTETCDEERPHLIIYVETTSATTQDKDMTEPIHQRLSDKRLLPAEHAMDAGYVDGDHLVNCQNTHAVELIGPVTSDPSWQARAGQGFDAAHFSVDWQARKATCPQGHTSRKWRLAINQRGADVIRVEFGKQDCLQCPCRSLCTTAPSNPRQLTLRPQAQYEAIQGTRRQQTTQEFHARYAIRAGVEGTISQGVRAFDLRRSRYIGQPKTHLQHVMTATAINFSRILNWIMAIPLDGTHVSRFAALSP